MMIENAMFIDKLGRKIGIEIDDLDIVAYHNSREVARFSFDEIYCGKGCSYIQLMYMKTEGDYRRAGIATKMMLLAVECHGNFSRPLLSAAGGLHTSAENYYTEEGRALILKCIDLGILSPDREHSEVDEYY